MSAVEETLARISTQGGVESFLITDGEGAILRMSKGLSAKTAALYASQVLALTARARHAVRDLDPKDDLEFFRLRTKDGREILAAPGSNSLVIVVQRWKTAADAAAAP